MNKYSLFSLFIFLFACRSEKNITIGVDKFPVEEMLISSVINVPPLVLAPANIFVTGNYFVITTPRKDTIFDIFSYPDFQYQFSAGVKGGGPDDFATMIDRRCPVSTKKGFNVFFVESKKYREIGIDIYNKRLYTIGEHKYTFEATDDIINGFMPLNDSVVIYLGGFIGKTEYKMLNVYTKEILSFGYYPQWVNSEENKALIYLKGTTAKPDGKKFASFYAYFKRWRIFDNHGNIEADINVNISPLTTDFSDRYTYYGYPFSTDKYIYVCCRNQKFGETQTDNTELQIWNWDGKPVAKYMLDKYIGCFTVDEQQNVLYGANSNEGNEDKIFKYHLP